MSRPDLETIARRQQEGRPLYFDDPRQDRLLALLLELAEEVCVQRDRVATAQILAESGEVVSLEAIDAFEPGDEERLRRLAEHRAYFTGLLESLLEA